MLVCVQEEKESIYSVFVRYVGEMSTGEFKFKMAKFSVVHTGSSVVADALPS